MASPSRSRTGLLLSLACIAAFLVASYAGGRDSYVRINDNLDFIVPVYATLAEEPLFGALDSRVEAPMGGLPRSSLVSALNLGVLPYLWIDPFHALVLNEIAMRLVAFLGMLLLLRRRLLPEGSDLVVYGAATCFALLPFLAVGHLSVAGQPLLLHTLLNLREGRGRALDWLFVVVFPLYSSLVYVGIYLLAALGVLVAWDTARTRRIPVALTGAVLAMGLLYAGSEYRLLHQTLFDPDYLSQRAEWAFRGRSLLIAGYNAAKVFLFNQHHAGAVQFPVVLGSVALGLAIFAAARDRASEVERRLARRLVAVMGVILVITAGVAVYNWQPVQDLLDALPFASMFGFHRFQWAHPLLFGAAFAMALEGIRRRGGPGPVLVGVLLVAQLGALAWHSDAWRERRDSGLSYREFYSPQLYAEVATHIGRPPSDYRVATLGLIPGIALFNGFRVVGGVTPNYPVSYKHRFRRAIAGELEKDERLRKHYDDWGVHVHLQSSELGMVAGYRKRDYYTRDASVRSVRDVSMDLEALAELGVEYVVSSVEIENHAALGLVPDRVFERDDSPWKLHLYRVPRALER